jgi:predicted SAM-dependent methyltransferase
LILPSPAIVNFGCGPEAADGCVNVDGSLTVLLAAMPLPVQIFGARAVFVRAARKFGIRYATSRRVRFPESSIDGFYTSHTLEHLEREECERLLRRVLDWLKPHGVLRVVLPDLRKLAEAYVCGKIDADAFVTRTYMAPASAVCSITRLVGHRDHKWMYDVPSFTAMLKRAGFNKIEEVGFGRSRLGDLEKLDVRARQYESFYIEAGK